VTKPAIVAPTLPILRACRAELSAQELVREREELGFATLLEFEQLFLVGPCVGAPAAVSLQHKLHDRGVTQIVLLSVAGALGPFQIGDLIVPASYTSYEGTSKFYPHEVETRSADLQIDLSSQLETQGLSFKQVHMASTDAPFREDEQFIGELKQIGVQAIDMEYSALAAATCVLNLELAALFVVSDIVSSSRSMGFTHTTFKHSLRLAAKEVVEFSLGRPT